MPRLFRLFVPALLALAPLAATAQTPCVGGMAGVYPCSNVDLLARIPLADFGLTGGPNDPNSSAEIWGWTDPQTSREYALIGLSSGIGFVDVTVPTAPVLVGRLRKPTGVSNSGWQSLRVYNNYVFLGSEAGGHGIQIFDLTRLRGVTTPTAFTQDARYAGVGSSHTITINEAAGFLYVVGADECGGGLHMVNIQNPLSPTFAGCYATDGYTHETQCLTYDGPDTDHQGKNLCVTYQGTGGNVNGGQISFVDVTNPATPVLISSAFYPIPGYSHQGWFTADKRHLLVNDEFDEPTAGSGTRTIVMNVEDLDNPTFDFNYSNGTFRTYAHNTYIIGSLAYESNYTSGLHILDISGIDSNTFTRVGYFDTYNQSNSLSYNGQWMNYPFFASGNIVASDIQNGLFVLRYTGTIPTTTEGPAGAASSGLALAGPNPFRDATALTLTLDRAQEVRVEAFDALGRRVAVLHDGPLSAGTHRLAFGGARLPAGVYLVRATGETVSATQRLSLAR